VRSKCKSSISVVNSPLLQIEVKKGEKDGPGLSCHGREKGGGKSVGSKQERMKVFEQKSRLQPAPDTV
jgi:hypothetical protein